MELSHRIPVYSVDKGRRHDTLIRPDRLMPHEKHAEHKGPIGVKVHTSRDDKYDCPACGGRGAYVTCHYCETGKVDATRLDIIERQLSVNGEKIG